MELITANQEQQIIEAVKQAVALVDEQRLEPSVAIEKVARQNRWGPDMIRFASHAYNTGRQTFQRANSESLLDKLAAFPLADPDRVIQAIWPTQVKSAVQQDWERVSDEYRHPPRFLQQVKAAEFRAAHVTEALEKQAKGRTGRYAEDMSKSKWGFRQRYRELADDEEPGPNEREVQGHNIGGWGISRYSSEEKVPKKQAAAYPERWAEYQFRQTPEYWGDTADCTSLSRTQAKQARIKRAAEEARRQATTALDQLQQLAGQLGRYFLQPQLGRTKFAELEKCAQAYLPESHKFLEFVYRTFQLKEARADRHTFAEHQPEQPPFSYLQQAVEVGRQVKQAQAEQQLLQQAYDKLANHAASFFPKKAFPLVAASVSTNVLPGEKQAAGFLGGAILGGGTVAATKSLMDKALSGEATRSRIDAEVSNLTDPEHEDELRRIRAQALLSELMDDEVIGGYDPEQVLQTFNEISQMAPRSATQPLVMRTLLRKHLQSNTEPFEAVEISDLERKLQDTGAAEPISSSATRNLFGKRSEDRCNVMSAGVH